jgi:hypothetical protein
VGVVLKVTPWITRDDQVVMYVKPEVSSGEINAKTELPEEETTEVETTLMLPDGHGMVIGGLIQETDIETQNKIPFVGDLWLIGRLFQERILERRRVEIIIALIPHIVPYPPARHQTECEQFCRADTPLLYGPLRETPRPFEPRFPDAGQRLPIRYKTQRFRAIPDQGAWPVPGPRDPCMPGLQPAPPEDHDAVPLPEPVPAPSGMPERGEMIPAPPFEWRQ